MVLGKGIYVIDFINAPFGEKCCIQDFAHTYEAQVKSKLKDEMKDMYIGISHQGCLIMIMIGVVVIASARGAEDPGSNPARM
jgi:hypothetical protein